MIQYYKHAMSNYFTFSGRASRSEYWWFILFYFIFLAIATFADMVLGTYNYDAGSGVISGLFGLVHVIPGLAVAVRRLHDTDRTGWWMLIILIPLVGWIVLLVFMVMQSTPGSNRFGPEPQPLPT